MPGRTTSNKLVEKTLPTYYCIYVLESIKDKKRYIGLTSNLKKRIRDHNKGKVFLLISESHLNLSTPNCVQIRQTLKEESIT